MGLCHGGPLRKAVGLEKVRFHDLRHTFITRTSELGVPLLVTKTAAGHMDDAMTEHYTYISTSVARLGLEKLERIRKAPHFVDEMEKPGESDHKLVI